MFVFERTSLWQLSTLKQIVTINGFLNGPFSGQNNLLTFCIQNYIAYDYLYTACWR